MEIRLVEVWDKIVTLKDLKKNAAANGPLSRMMVIHRGDILCPNLITCKTIGDK